MRARTVVAVLIFAVPLALDAQPAAACINETTMAHDEAVRLVAKAVAALEQGEYAAAAKSATKAEPPRIEFRTTTMRWEQAA
jgi:hypothetical protein